MESLRNAHQLATPNAKVIISFYDYTLLSPKLTVKYEEKAIHFDSMSTLFSSFFLNLKKYVLSYTMYNVPIYRIQISLKQFMGPADPPHPNSSNNIQR